MLDCEKENKFTMWNKHEKQCGYSVLTNFTVNSMQTAYM